MLLAELVDAADTVASTRARTKKFDSLAGLLQRCSKEEIPIAVGFLTGFTRQGRIGIGFAQVSKLQSEPASAPSLTLHDVDAALDEIARTTGAGSTGKRAEILASVFSRATSSEAAFLRRLLLGDLRQGALEGVMADAIARASETDAELVRRAWMLSGNLANAAGIALTEGNTGLKAIGLELLRPVEPMLASTADDVATALDGIAPASVEWKLDGIRIQVHRNGEEIRVYTRNLNEITERLPEVVAIVASLPAEQLVLDGEAIGMSDDDRPLVFQEIMSRVGRTKSHHEMAMVPFFFDVLHANGRDLIDEPLVERRRVLDEIAGRLRIPSIVTSDANEGKAFLDEALATGHEGVVVKAWDSTYQAGRRGATWRKVKPAHTFDLVVLGAEWGYGRRTGWLSNLHLGARDPDGGFVMVGKTFKGLTDETLKWQTEEFLKLEVSRSGNVVFIKPEIVVEIALDGVQASTRYPGGIALRFARVKRYRPDKDAKDADTLESLRAMLR